MRVYSLGHIVPMCQVTIDLLTTQGTLITNEDPHIPLPIEIEDVMNEMYVDFYNTQEWLH